MKKKRRISISAIFLFLAIGLFFNLTITTVAAPPEGVVPGPPDRDLTMVELGRKIFFEETFAGNGRTCGTCHPAENNLTIDPAFIATLPPDDPLFIAENNPDLGALENPTLMRSLGLILENLNGFDQPGVLRGVPHMFSMGTSLNPSDDLAAFRVHAVGWSGDGSPSNDSSIEEDGSLRAFTIGAIRQHFPKTLARTENVDFRLPTKEELDALEAFMLSLGRSEEVDLTELIFADPVVEQGKVLFNGQGKCKNCHFNAGANTMASCSSGTCVNANFATGVESQSDLPSFLIDDTIPRDDGFGSSGDFFNAAFNTPVLVEAADTPPFFHNDSAFTIEAAVGFFNTETFNSSPSGTFLQGLEPSGPISLDASQVTAIASLLRTLNALENIRLSNLQDQMAMMAKLHEGKELLAVSLADTQDAIEVLSGGNVVLFPEAVALLRQALDLVRQASQRGIGKRNMLLEQSVALREAAKAEILI